MVDALQYARRENEISTEFSESADIDRRTVRIGRIVAGVVVPEAESRLADPLGTDHVRISESQRKIVDLGIVASVQSRQRTEGRVLVVLPCPVRTQEKVVSVPHSMIETGDHLLPLLGERKNPAVLLEEIQDSGVVGGNEPRCDLVHQRPERHWRCYVENVDQSLLRVRERGQERSVGKQRHDQCLVPVQAFVSAEQERLVPLDRTSGGSAALRPRVGAFAWIEVVSGLEPAVA